LETSGPEGLNAIAIADHHDFAFFPYVKKAAQDELDDGGKPVLGEKRLIVSPGIEMTIAAPPCQALLIVPRHNSKTGRRNKDHRCSRSE
jgi:chromosome segregation protein